MKPADHENRSDRRFAENQTGKRQVVVVMRERGGKALSFVFKTEGASVPTIMNRLSEFAVVHTDDATSWNELHDRFLTKRIDHSAC